MATLFCYTPGGLPLFSVGPQKSMPPSHHNTLQATREFASTRGGLLYTATTEGSKLVWQSFDDRIVLLLLLADDSADDSATSHFLQRIYAAFILIFGQDALGNRDKLKRLLSNNIFAQLLELMLKEADLLLGLHMGAVDIMVPPDPAAIQEAIETHAVAACTNAAWLQVKGKLVSATSDWWTLNADDRILLTLLVRVLGLHTFHDIDVFLLPGYDSLSLLVAPVAPGVQACALVPSEGKPTLDELTESVPSSFRHVMAQLASLSEMVLDGAPSVSTPDAGLQGYLLLDRAFHRCLLAFPTAAGSGTGSAASRKQTGPDLAETGVLPPERRSQIASALFHGYRQFLAPVLPGDSTPFFGGAPEPQAAAATAATSANTSATSSPHAVVHTVAINEPIRPSDSAHEMIASYWRLEGYTLYALRRHHFQLIVYATDEVPLFALKDLCEKLFSNLAQVGLG